MFAASKQPWLREPCPAPGMPIMISKAEQRYLHWLGRTQWSDEGHVIEIGPWLGGSTACLVAGMRAGRAAARHRLHAFDNFVWREFMTRFASLPIAPGDSFEPWFLKNVETWSDLVVAHRQTLPDETIEGDKQSESWRGAVAPAVEPFAWSGEPIEILFVDGAKSWRGMRWLLSCVAGSLIAGRTLLVAQDFKHWGSYWVPLMLARFQSSLELRHVVERGSTATFLLREPLDARKILELPDHVAQLDLKQSLEDLRRMAAWIESAGDPVGACHVLLGAVQLQLHQGRTAEALASFEQVQARWPLRGAKGQLEDARATLVARGLEPRALRRWSRILSFRGGAQGR